MTKTIELQFQIMQSYDKPITSEQINHTHIFVYSRPLNQLKKLEITSYRAHPDIYYTIIQY